MLTLYDAPRCPYCARVRIVLAEKGVDFETVTIDLENRPAGIYDKNPTGRVPVLEEDELVIPESRVLMEYLDERYPEPPLLPAHAAERALARLPIERFDAFATDYYALRRGDEDARERVHEHLARLDAALEAQPWLGGREYGLADIAYVPWIVRARAQLGVELDDFPQLARWLDRLAERPAIAAELGVVAALAR